jgi:hypothetical protein
MSEAELPTNDACRSFLDSLDDADNVEVTAWEAEFIESNMKRELFTDKQRSCIGRMMDKYGDKIDW